MDLAKQIADKAVALGFESCGIIRVEEMAGYGERLAERMDKVPSFRTQGERLAPFAHPQAKYPWAKAVVVCAGGYRQFKVPPQLQGVVGRTYLFDSRTDPNAPRYRSSLAFERFLEDDCGLQIAFDRRFPFTAVRWAAAKAGLGIFRKNNFVYGPHGSWVGFEAFLIDRELEYIVPNDLKPCPENCTRCVDACPTGSLCAPFVMERASCISELTTWAGRDFPNDPYAGKTGPWLYGCDACQEACPFNQGKWQGDEDFPGLAETADKLTPEAMLAMDYEELLATVQPKLWYVKPEEAWKYKTNALNLMKNNYEPRYRPLIEQALDDAHEKVREMARWVLHHVPG